ncbi:hypothetical protein GOBAR_DD20122 [Gossypium barbadense]|nr:hypothetical protein GOBAR_DD20122 [Gossypium barbadense]
MFGLTEWPFHSVLILHAAVIHLFVLSPSMPIQWVTLILNQVIPKELEGLSPYEHHYRMLRNYGKLDEGFNNYYPYAKLKNLVSRLPNEKETIYGALDKWVAWEIEFPLIAAAKALRIFKKRSQ